MIIFVVRVFLYTSMTLGSMVVLSACGEYNGPSTTGILRCKDDGFCLTYVKDKNWSGAFRKGDKELQFDSFYFRNWETILNHGENFSFRIRTEKGHTYLRSGLKIPEDWAKDKEEEVKESRLDLNETDFYEDIARTMQSSLPRKSPKHVDEISWRLFLNNVDSFVEDSTIAEGIDRNVDQSNVKSMLHLKKNGEEKKDINLKNLENINPHEISLSGGNHHGAKAIAPTELRTDPGFEFTQVIDLFSQPWTFFGIKTKKHHTATRTQVFKRRLGSNDRWRRIERLDIANHGAGPAGNKMQHYAHCESLPVTQGYFVWQGECEGDWGTHHLCNDDTAYQVYHAYGEHNGMQRCLGKRRDHRPWCDKPW